MGRQEVQFFQDPQQTEEPANLHQTQSSDSISSASTRDESDSDSDSESASSTITDGIEDSSDSPSNEGPLFELSDLMTQLPIKRGLSKYYEGKSQSFTSLEGVQSLEDLPKKENPYNTRMKMCKSYAYGLDAHPQHYMKRVSSKRVSSSSSFLSTMCNRPPVPM